MWVDAVRFLFTCTVRCLFTFTSQAHTKHLLTTCVARGQLRTYSGTLASLLISFVSCELFRSELTSS